MFLREWEWWWENDNRNEESTSRCQGLSYPSHFLREKALETRLSQCSRGCLVVPAVLLSNAGGSRHPDGWRLSTQVQSSYINSLMNGAFCDEIIIWFSIFEDNHVTSLSNWQSSWYDLVFFNCISGNDFKPGPLLFVLFCGC